MAKSLTQRLISSVALLLAGLCLITLRLSGLYAEPGDPLDNMRHWTVAEATDYSGSRTGPVRIDGRLRAENPVYMPDNGEAVLRGWFRVRLLGHKKDAKTSLSRTLFSWEEVAHPILLEQDDVVIPLRTSPLDLPLYQDVDIQSTIIYQNDLPVKVKVGQLSWPIQGEDWAGTEVEVKVERAHLPLGLSVSTLAAIDGSRREAILTPLPGHGMTVVEKWPEQPDELSRALVASVFAFGLLITLLAIAKIRNLIADMQTSLLQVSAAGPSGEAGSANS